MQESRKASDETDLDLQPLTDSEEEKDIYALGARPPKSLDLDYYLLSSAWCKKWRKHMYEGGEGPGQIDNSTLFADKTLVQLHPNLLETIDYRIVSNENFARLVEK